MLYNPLKEKITRTIKLPLYYTGLKSVAVVADKGKTKKTFTIDRKFEMELTFTIEPEGYTWFTIE